MVKVPLPLHPPVAPVTVQVPVILPPLTMPSRINVLTVAPVELTT
jgi:hypothetical protein